jgi:translation initiation factor 1
MSKKKREGGGMVYSTDPGFRLEDEHFEEQETLPPNQQQLIVGRSTKGRGGKTVTVVSGFKGREEDLESLCKTVKNKCGVGGSVKDGEILIQGEMRQKVAEVLQKEGYKTKISG